LTMTPPAHSLPVMYSVRNLNLIIFLLSISSPAKRDCTGRSVQPFFDWHHDVGLDTRTALGRCLAPAKPTESGTATAAAEKRFEKVAESCTVELKVNSATSAAPLMISAAGLLSLPLPVRRWLEAARPVPIGAELIIFLALFCVA